MHGKYFHNINFDDLKRVLRVPDYDSWSRLLWHDFTYERWFHTLLSIEMSFHHRWGHVHRWSFDGEIFGLSSQRGET